MAREQLPIDASRKGREGSRWINERPDGEEVAKWFKESVTLHEGMGHEDYVSGVTIIPAKETYSTIGYVDGSPDPIIGDMMALTFTPYIRVDTRIRYFWDWMAKHDEWIGTIERVKVAEQDPHLPDGFFYQQVRRADDKEVTFIGCSMRVTVVKRDGGEAVIEAPAATKLVPVLNRYGEDPNAMMKAETGAIGRALGFAGILVAPGSGIATAEDMQEAITLAQGAGAAPAAPEPQLPSEPESEDELRKMAEQRLNDLRQYPGPWATFQEWAQERSFKTLADVGVPQLKGMIRKLDKMLDDAVESGARKLPDPEPEPESPALIDAPKPEPAAEPEPEATPDGPPQDS